MKTETRYFQNRIDITEIVRKAIVKGAICLDLLPIEIASPRFYPIIPVEMVIEE